nr:MAG: AAA family ATPase [Candidatus Methanoperedens sp.]
MLITSVELNNIKSYRHAVIELKEGINGICGQNGHGKTTILEAIGYVLFHSLPYKEADFLRRGEKSGRVSVEILADNVPYILTRKLGGECSVRGGNVNIVGSKEVLTWLASKVFAVSTESELTLVFDSAVGVPQGMFTSAFMDIPSRRKKTFDEILRVDEYRNAYENLRNTMNLIDEGVKNIQSEIVGYRIRTEQYGTKKEDIGRLSVAIEGIKKDLRECIVNLDAAKVVLDELKKQKSALDRLESEIRQGQVRLGGFNQQLTKARSLLGESEEAQKIVSALQADSERYKEMRKRVEMLESMRKERDALKDKLSQIKNELTIMCERRSRLESIRSDVDGYSKKKAALLPMIEKQAEHEKIIEGKKGERAVALRAIQDIKNRMVMVGTENVCPVMKGVRCGSVTDFSSYFKQQLLDAQNTFDTTELLLKSLGVELMNIGDPRSKVMTLSSFEQKGIDEIAKITREIEGIPGKELALEDLGKGLEVYATLSNDISEAGTVLRELEPVYQRYIQTKPLALKLAVYRTECEMCEKTIVDEGTRLEELGRQFAEVGKGFSAEALELAESKSTELGARVCGLEVVSGEKEAQFKRLGIEVAEMEVYLSKIVGLEEKLGTEKRFREYAQFVRETLRDSAQHIVLQLIGEISEEANSLYCAIMDDFSQELQWSDDYGITVIEGGEKKVFQQLSGGEKMGAALALRLSLLKMLSNSDFVFLDEPTQNMDEIRRENLSEQIMNIKGFKQVFVISHDDAFNEKYGNVIRIEKVDGESRVAACGDLPLV